ncbi:MAG: PEP/pyruvate-binding domain-containing protein [Candidatus Sericytochromatia bacterium]
MASGRLLGPDCGPEASAELGGKGRRLWQMGRLGLPVPPWVCVPMSTFRQVLVPHWEKISAQLARPDADPAGLAESCRSLLADLHLPAGLEAALRSASDGLGGDFFAVRSSAAGEDQAGHAFAGLFRTWLQTPAQDVPGRVLACWQAAFSAPVLAYLLQRGLGLSSLEMAVLVQVQIPAEVSGILFQAGPDGNLNDQVIVAGYGLGEGLVSGEIAGDTYLRDRYSGEWREDIVPKPRMLAAGRTGPEIREVSPAQQALPALSRSERLELLALGERLAPLAEGFQDIEFCRCGGQWYLLQSRPITTLPPGPYHYFDSSNIQESYPGLVLPLTASLVRRGYAVNFTTTLHRLGFSRGFLARQQAVLSTMTAEIEGRLYYHMQHWTHVLQWLPGARRLALQSFAAMISRPPDAPARSQLFELGRDLLLGLKLYPILLLRLLSLPLAMKAYRRRFLRLYTPFAALEPAGLEAEALIESYDRAFTRFLPLFYVPLLNDLWTGIVCGLLRQRLSARLGDSGEALLHDLMADLAGLESARPLLAVQALADRLRASPELMRLLAESPAPEAWKQILHSPEHADFSLGLQAYLQAYGGRSLQELKLEVPSFLEEPWRLLTLVRQQAEMEAGQSGAAAMGRGRELQQGAVSRLRSCWPFWHPGLLLCRLLLTACRRALIRREAGRLDRTRLMAAARRIFGELGTKLQARGWLERAEDIFYLRQEELLDLGQKKGQERPPDPAIWRDRVQRRRECFVAWRACRPRERLLLPAAVGEWPIPQQFLPADPGQLQGTGCAGSLAEGEVLVVLEPVPELDVRDKILVTISTDPGWVFLMARARGLVTEQGNLLSHAAILARELGLTTVVGVSGATRLLQNGEKIRIDGHSGRIERLDPL